MKYIIAESRLNKIIFSYLDGENWGYEDVGDGEFNLHDEKTGKDVMRYRKTFYRGSGEMSMFLKPSLVYIIKNLFDMTTYDAFQVISDWIKKNYDVHLPVENMGWIEDGSDF